MPTLVTKDTIRDMLQVQDQQRIAKVIGRALVAIYKRQTAAEQAALTTNQDNGVGFTGADAAGGSLTAKYFLKHGTLLDWQVARWMKPAKSGYPRLCKYHKQLNEVANERLTLYPQ